MIEPFDSDEDAQVFEALQLFDAPVPLDEIYTLDEIVNAAIAYFKAIDFPIREVATHVAMQELNVLAAMSLEQLRVTSLGYAIADKYHPHRYEIPIQQGKTRTVTTAQDVFRDERLLRFACEKAITMSGELPQTWFSMLGLVHGTQIASQFRPGYAAYTYRRFAETDAVVIDPCAGWGGRLLGAIAARNVSQYIGVDPSPRTVAGNRALADDLAAETFVTIVESAIEDTPLDAHDAQADVVFTCPPYWVKEHYEGDDQSWSRYSSSFDEWCYAFLKPMMMRAQRWAKRDAVVLIVVADVKIGSEIHPLVERTISAGIDAGLIFERRELFPMARAPGKGEAKPRAETALLFRNTSAAATFSLSDKSAVSAAADSLDTDVTDALSIDLERSGDSV